MTRPGGIDSGCLHSQRRNWNIIKLMMHSRAPIESESYTSYKMFCTDFGRINGQRHPQRSLKNKQYIFATLFLFFWHHCRPFTKLFFYAKGSFLTIALAWTSHSPSFYCYKCIFWKAKKSSGNHLFITVYWSTNWLMLNV